MKYKVHWLIDGLIEVDANNAENAEKLLRIKLKLLLKTTQFSLKK